MFQNQEGEEESQHEQMENLNTIFTLVTTPPPTQMAQSVPQKNSEDKDNQQESQGGGSLGGKSTVLGSDQPSAQAPSEL